MKCLALMQPWASLVVLGAKRVETRSWRTSHRGPLAVMASRRFPAECRQLCLNDAFWSALVAGGYWIDAVEEGRVSHNNLPTGMILGTVELIGCWPTERCRHDADPKGDDARKWKRATTRLTAGFEYIGRAMLRAGALALLGN